MVTRFPICSIPKWTETLLREKCPKSQRKGIPFHLTGTQQSKRKPPGTTTQPSQKNRKNSELHSDTYPVEGEQQCLAQVRGKQLRQYSGKGFGKAWIEKEDQGSQRVAHTVEPRRVQQGDVLVGLLFPEDFPLRPISCLHFFVLIGAIGFVPKERISDHLVLNRAILRELPYPLPVRKSLL